MHMKRVFIRKIIIKPIFALVLIALILPFGLQTYANNSMPDAVEFFHDAENSYTAYINRHGNASRPNTDFETRLPARDFYASDFNTSIINYLGYEGALKISGARGFIEWEVELDEGLYYLGFDFAYDTDGRKSLYDVHIDGELPFNEIRGIPLGAVYRDTALVGTLKDSRNNDIRPPQEMVAKWQFQEHMNINDKDANPFLFYFSGGKHTISLVISGEQLILGDIVLFNRPGLPTYEEALAHYMEMGYLKGNNTSEIILAQNPYQKSSTVLIAGFDRSSPLTMPASANEIVLNTIGGLNWSKTGQWISWQVEVPEDGLYQIAIRYRQNLMQGSSSTRRVYINGEVPFLEAGAISFPYNSGWRMLVLGGGEPYQFYLTEGINEIKMEVVLGEMAEIIKVIEECTYDLNELYRRVVMITGITPDPLRDYFIERQVPDFSEILNENSQKLLSGVSEVLKESTGNSGENIAMIENAARVLSTLAERPEDIKNRLNRFKDAINNLGAFVVTVSDQPLELDYILVYTQDQSLPKTRPGFFENLFFSIRAFFSSFKKFEIADAENSRGSLRVWVGGGREQLQIYRNMIDDMFTPEYGIDVTIELVIGSLMEALMAGQNPDITFGNSPASVVNFAMRGALVDICQFDGFEEATLQFSPSALVPFRYNGKYYSIPETQGFDIMYYRKDIFADLGLSVPQTWDDFYRLAPIIKRNNLQIGLPPLMANVDPASGTNPNIQNMFSMFLFQYGGSYYNEDLTETAFDTEEAIRAFVDVTELYTMYEFPMAYDFITLFKMGVMPLYIGSYTGYTGVRIIAPEINGLWDIAPLPGTPKSDGTIDRSASSQVGGPIILRNTQTPKDAWKFVNWWVSTPAQVRWGQEIEAVLGPAGRYATANIEAMKSLPWTLDEQEVILAQWEHIQGVPEAPGSYFIPIGVSNALRTTITYRGNPRLSINYWNGRINEELARKRRELSTTLS